MATISDSYIDRIAVLIHRTAEPESNPLEYIDLYRYYAVLALIKGHSVTNEDIHNAWAAWCSEHEPEHRSLVEYDKLPQHIQDLDTPYTEATRAVANWLRLGFIPRSAIPPSGV